MFATEPVAKCGEGACGTRAAAPLVHHHIFYLVEACMTVVIEVSCVRAVNVFMGVIAQLVALTRAACGLLCTLKKKPTIINHKINPSIRLYSYCCTRTAVLVLCVGGPRKAGRGRGLIGPVH